jgi:hypothetical protein
MLNLLLKQLGDHRCKYAYAPTTGTKFRRLEYIMRMVVDHQIKYFWLRGDESIVRFWNCSWGGACGSCKPCVGTGLYA